MKKILSFSIILLCIVYSNSQCQYLHNITRVDSLNDFFGFEQTLLNSNNNIVDLSMNYKPGYEAPLLLTEMDDSGIILKSKKIKFFSDSLEFFCNGAGWPSGTQFALAKSLYSPTDSSYYFAGVLLAHYGVCSTLATNAFLKLDNNLDTVWLREYYTAAYSGLNISFDNGLIASALSNIRKLNPLNGDTIWSRTYLPSNGNSFALLGQNRAYNDSEFVVCGGTNLFSHITRRGILTKFNQNGNILWSYAYGDSTPEYFHAVNPTNDSSYIIVNEHDYNNNADASVIKISNDGTFLWGKYYDKPGKKVAAYDIVNTPDNNYFVTLSVLDTLSFVQKAFLLKIDSLGNIIWSHKFNPPVTLGNYQELHHFIPTPDGGYYINGTRLIKIDSTGYGCWFINENNAVIQHDLFFTTDTTPLIYQPYPPFYEDNKYINHIVPATFIDSMWVDSCLNTTGINDANHKADDFIIYPNPTINKLTIQSEQLANKRTTVTVNDLLGKQKLQIIFIVSSDGKIDLDINNLESGIYFIRINNRVQKFIKM